MLCVACERRFCSRENWSEIKNGKGVVCIKTRSSPASLQFRGLACVSQKTRKLLGPENFSGLFSGAFLGFQKAFLKAPDFLPRFSGMFSGNVTQGIARASIFQPVIGSKIAIDTVALSWVRHVRIKFKNF